MSVTQELSGVSPSLRAEILTEALPYIRSFRGKRIVIKLGGSAMIQESLRQKFAEDIVLTSFIGMKPIIVHGGGPQIGAMLKKLNINSFIPLDKVPFNRVTGWYYVGNDPKNGDIEAFATIVQAMDQKKLAAVTKWVPRTRQEMLVLYVQDGMMFAVSVAFAASVQEPPVTSTARGSFPEARRSRVFLSITSSRVIATR